ncbi:MAG: hypothetical protein ACETWM_14555, partial [Candidatus Lokiarchaeia archaeon]
MSNTEKDNLERVKQAVEDRAHLDPELQYKFVFEPVRVVESVAEIEKVPIKPEEAEKIAKELELPIKGGWPFIWGGLYSGMAMHVIERIKRGYDSILGWSRILFWFGLALIILAIGIDIAGIVLNTSNPLGIFLGFNWQQFVASSGILGGIGLISLVTSFIRFSFKEMKNTIGDLVQMSVIFHSFLDQITLLKTQIE